MMFNHCGGPSFWADLYELADRSKSIIFLPSEQSIYVYTDDRCRRTCRKVHSTVSAWRSGADIVAAIEAS